MGLYEKVTNVLSFNILQTVLSKGLAFINFAILIRLLTQEEIGALGLAAGYVGLLGLILILPESVFIRDFPKIRNRLNEYLSAFFGFSIIRSIVLIGLGVGVAYWMHSVQIESVVIGYFLLLVITAVLNSLTGPFREAFYASFRQARITFIDLSLNFVSIASLIFLYFSRNLITYGLLQVGVALIGVGWWYWNARKRLGFTFHPFPGWWGVSWVSISGFALWNHLSGVVIRLISQADIVILGFFAPLSELGDYSIALAISMVFFVFPQLVQKVISLSFSQNESNSASPRMLGVAVRYNTVFSLGQFIVYLAMGPWIVSLLGPLNPEKVFEYSFYLVGGVTLYNLARPWLSLIVIKVDPRRFFLELFLIPCLISIPIYWFFAQYHGPLGVAQANVVTYGFLAIMTILYATWKTGIIPRFEWLSFEKRILSHFFGHSKK